MNRDRTPALPGETRSGGGSSPRPLDALKEILERLVSLHLSLPPLMEEEAAACLERRFPDMESHTRRIEEVLARIRAASREREETTRVLATQLGLDAAPPPTLLALHQALGGRTDLPAIRQRLLDAVKVAEERNNKNKAILSGVMEAHDFLIRLLQKASDQTSYSRGGEKQGNPEIHLFSKRF